MNPASGKGSQANAFDEQVFLVMGIDGDETAVAIVVGRDADAACRKFEESYPGMRSLTWPSLAEIKMSVAMLEAARDGWPVDGVDVIDARRSH